MPKPLEKWLVEALSSVSTNNNHYNQKDLYTYLSSKPDNQIASAEVTAVGFFGNRSESISKTL